MAKPVMPKATFKCGVWIYGVNTRGRMDIRVRKYNWRRSTALSTTTG